MRGFCWPNDRPRTGGANCSDRGRTEMKLLQRPEFPVKLGRKSIPPSPRNHRNHAEYPPGHRDFPRADGFQLPISPGADIDQDFSNDLLLDILRLNRPAANGPTKRPAVS